MLGTRLAVQRAGRTSLPQDDQEPVTDNTMVADYGPNHPAKPEEPHHEQGQAAGVIERTTRSLADYWANRSTPGRTTRTPLPPSATHDDRAVEAGEPSMHSGPGALMEELLAHREEMQAKLQQMDAHLARLEVQDAILQIGGKGPGSGGRRARMSSHIPPPRSSLGRGGDEVSTAGDDDEMIGTYLQGVKSIDSEETKNYKLSMKREDIVVRLPDLLDDLAGRHFLLERALSLTEEERRMALDLDSDDYEPGIHAADRYIKRQIMKVINRSTTEGEVFCADEADLRRRDRSEQQSGLAMAERVLGFGAITDRAEADAHLKKLETTVWFALGDPEIKIKSGINKLRAAWYELPKKHRDANELIDVLIKVIPPDVAHDTERTYAQRLAHEMDEHEELEGGRKWTFEQLKGMIVKRLRCARDGGVAHDPGPSGGNVNAAVGKASHDDGGARARKYAGKILTGKMGKWLGERNSFCFIKPDGDIGPDLFCHKSAIEGDVPEEGAKMQFQIAYANVNGKMRERAIKMSGQTADATVMVAMGGEQIDEDEDDGGDFGPGNVVCCLIEGQL
jgi:cold shock CspA family protein